MSAPIATPQANTRMQLAAGHVTAVLGDTPLAEVVKRELETARLFTFIGQKNGLMLRVAEQIIRLQEQQKSLPEVNGST